MLQKLALAIGLFLFAVTSLIVGADDVGELVLGLVLCAVLVTVALTDLQRRVIPNATVLAGSVAAIAIAMVSDPGSLPDRALAALVAGGVLFALALAYPRGMGMGDAKLLAMMGLYLGRAVAPAVVIAFMSGGLGGLVLIGRHGKGARKRTIPFGPFLALGGILGLWFGEDIVDWYLDEFFRGD